MNNFKRSLPREAKRSGGLTLVEILTAASIATIIMVAVFNFGQGLFSFNRNAQKDLNAQTDARRVLKNFVKELREASPSSLGGYPLVSAGTSTLTFFSNIDADNYKEQIRYFLDGTDLKRGVTKPSGSPLTYDPGDEEVTTMVRSVSNGTSTPIFEYFDSGFAGTSTPLAYPMTVSRIRLTKITVMIGAFTATSQVFSRNLKDNL